MVNFQGSKPVTDKELVAMEKTEVFDELKTAPSGNPDEFVRRPSAPTCQHCGIRVRFRPNQIDGVIDVTV